MKKISKHKRSRTHSRSTTGKSLSKTKKLQNRYDVLVTWKPKKLILTKINEERLDDHYSYVRDGKYFVGVYGDAGNFDKLPIDDVSESPTVRTTWNLGNRIPKEIREHFAWEDLDTDLEKHWYADENARGNNASEIRLILNNYDELPDAKEIIIGIDFIGTKKITDKDMRLARETILDSLTHFSERALKVHKRNLRFREEWEERIIHETDEKKREILIKRFLKEIEPLY